jgi:hypothetical protein
MKSAVTHFAKNSHILIECTRSLPCSPSSSINSILRHFHPIPNSVTYSLKRFFTFSNLRLRITLGSGVEINVCTYFLYLHALCIRRANHHPRKNGVILSHQKCSESDIHLLSTDYPNSLSTLLGQVSYCCTCLSSITSLDEKYDIAKYARFLPRIMKTAKCFFSMSKFKLPDSNRKNDK